MKIGLLAAAALLVATNAEAQTAVMESGDAGQTLSAAQNTMTGTGGSTIGSINGSLSAYTDADLFKIYISSPSTFSATSTTLSTTYGPGGLDTALSLFNMSGVAIATNDDSSGSSVEAALAAGNPLYSGLSAGVYYLGIALSGNEAVNANNQLLFQGYIMGDTTSTRGAATGVTPTTLSNFNGNVDPENADTGTYQIRLTGVTSGPSVAAAAPEPATWVLMILGGGFAGYALRRRRLTTAAAISA